jgi:hypothetical protein
VAVDERRVNTAARQAGQEQLAESRKEFSFLPGRAIAKRRAGREPQREKQLVIGPSTSRTLTKPHAAFKIVYAPRGFRGQPRNNFFICMTGLAQLAAAVEGEMPKLFMVRS